MTTRSLTSHVGDVGSDPARILRILKVATALCTPIHETDFATQFARAGCADDLQRDNFDVLPEQVVDDHVEVVLHNESVNEERPIPKNESCTQSGYSGPAHYGVCGLIREALKEQKQSRLRRLLDERQKNVALDSFKDALQQAKSNFYTHVFQVMEHMDMKDFFNGKAEELLNDEMYKLAHSVGFT